MKDRLSVHIDNGQSGVREAVTVLRNGGQASQSGLVGITNAVYSGVQDPTIPATIFNVQSTGDSNIRFSSGPSVSYRSSIELLGNGNERASGLHISYDPQLDDAYVFDSGGIHVSPSAVDQTVVDFSLIRPSGTEGLEFSHLSISERGFIGMGLTRAGGTRKYHPNAPLTVFYDDDHVTDSGTVSLHEQATSPSATSSFGKIYVKPLVDGSKSQALCFMDDNGVETNMVATDDTDPTSISGGMIFGDNQNTYGGWFTPSARSYDSEKSGNTYYGWGAGFTLSASGEVNGNTIVGHKSGSGLQPTSSYNTIVGHDNLTGWTAANRNVVIGDGNLASVSGAPGGMDNCILIGSMLYVSDLPDDGTLAVGYSGTPLLLGSMTGASKYLTIQGNYFSVLDTTNSEFKVGSESDAALSGTRYITNMDIIDPSQAGGSYGENNLKVRFLNDDALSMTLLEIDPRGGPLSNTPTYEAPASETPFAKLDADFKLRGAIRFQDGTSVSGLSDFNLILNDGTSGVNVANNRIVLDYTELQLAGNVASEIRTDNTYVAVQVDGSGSTTVGKMSLQGFTDYISSGTSSIGENCNILISNPENELLVNTSASSRSVMIGCDVAYGASGWKHSVIIGSEAGANATVSNPSLDIDTACIFLGYRAGYECDDVDNIIAIGTNAGNNAEQSSDSVFIGSNAGLNTTYAESIGIGESALRGTLGGGEGGSGNLEIVCGIDDNNRLMYNMGNLSERFNIMNVIAGRSDLANVSVGSPRLSPTSPFEVHRDSSVHSSNPNDYIQTWYCNDTLVASIDCDGNFNVTGSGGIASASFIEGIFQTSMSAAGSISSPASGRITIYENGVSSGSGQWITNRDSTLTASSGNYVMAVKMNTEYRPTWVSCDS